VDLPLWLLALLVVGSTHRVTRLLARDQLPLVAWPRERLVLFWFPAYAEAETRDRFTSRHGQPPRPHWAGVGRSLAYLVTCDWCVSMYVAAGITYATWRWTPLHAQPWIVSVLLALVASSVTGLVAQREPD